MTEQNNITAIIIVPPEHVQNHAWPLMHRHARDDLARLPAHITVLAPWVPVNELAVNCAILEVLCASISPIELTLRDYGKFPGVTYMKLADEEPFQQLFQQISASYPEYLPYDGAFGAKPTPHLTVGKFSSKAAQKQADYPKYLPLTFTVTHLHVMTGPHDEVVPWDAYDVIALDG